METKIIAIAAVAILVVAGAGVGVYYMMNNNNSTIDGKDFDGSSGALLVYGNANEDNTIDGCHYPLRLFQKLLLQIQTSN